MAGQSFERRSIAGERERGESFDKYADRHGWVISARKLPVIPAGTG